MEEWFNALIAAIEKDPIIGIIIIVIFLAFLYIANL